MPLRDYHGYLSDVVNAIQKIQNYCEGETFEGYLADEKLRDAVERNLSILGEALVQAKRHYPRVEQDISNLQQIIGFRNRLIHAYLHVDDKTVWGIITDNLEVLLDEALVVIGK